MIATAPDLNYRFIDLAWIPHTLLQMVVLEANPAHSMRRVQRSIAHNLLFFLLEKNYRKIYFAVPLLGGFEPPSL